MFVGKIIELYGTKFEIKYIDGDLALCATPEKDVDGKNKFVLIVDIKDENNIQIVKDRKIMQPFIYNLFKESGQIGLKVDIDYVPEIQGDPKPSKWKLFDANN